ncbi:hypothetical protein Q5O14_13030 [Eubacteriaceae bacterium ES2]|nr:hypothetical protein Q5O14_13030 [Eubacteriaceae bacterium ES2]
MKKITASILTVMLTLSMVFSSSVFAAEKTSAWDSFVGLFSNDTATTAANDVGVEYRGHVENKGDFPLDGSWIQGPEQLGTVGEGLRLEAFWIKLVDAPEGLHIKYEVHVQNKGWMDPVEDGALAGTEGEGLRIEAIKISLVDDEGNVSGDYSVAYKGHVQNQGDTEWYYNGDQLGTTGSGLRLEALEVEISKIAPDMTAYEAALAAVSEENYTAASWEAYQEVVAANVMTEDNVQSEVDAATAAIMAAQEDLVAIPVISGMTATGQKTITVSGTQLDNLTADMLSVAGYTVSAVTPSADGTTAAVALSTDLAPETNVLVTATIDGTATEYTVKYSIAATTVAIQSATYDDDTANQQLTLLVDGVQTSVSYLNLAGYTVNFTSWDSNSVATTGLFGAQTSTTGLLSATPTKGSYLVQVTIAKGSTIATSEKATIKVEDLNNNTQAINAYKLYLGTGAVAGTDTLLASSTLVYGETANIGQVTVGAGSTQAILSRAAAANYPTCGYSYVSSNSTILSVNDTTGLITASGIGTANITVTVGQATKVIPITVTGTARAITKATPSVSTYTYVIGGSNPTVTMAVTDQYGDPVTGAIAATALTYAGPGITNLTVAPLSGAGFTADAYGKFALTFSHVTAPSTSATGSIVFKNVAGTTVGSFGITVTDVTNVGSQKVIITTTSSSQDNTINTDIESGITFQVANYNSNGVFTGYVTDLTGYQVLFDNTILADSVAAYDTTINGVTLGAVANYTLIPATPVKAGSTTVAVYNASSKLIDSRAVTVTTNAPYITGVTFNSVATVDYATTLNYMDVLNITESANDDIISSGITLSTTQPYTMRIGQVLGTEGYIYLDKVADGVYTAGDILLGTLTEVVSSTTGAPAMVNPTNAITGLTTVSGNAGVVTFVVTDTVSDPDVYVGTTGVTVNVP